MKENVTDTIVSFLDIDLEINENDISIKLFDKRESFSFEFARMEFARMPFCNSNIPSKIYHSPISFETLHLARITVTFIMFLLSY